MITALTTIEGGRHESVRSGCGAINSGFRVGQNTASAKEVNFITDFGFNGHHSYFCVALDKGYYKAEGLEVNITVAAARSMLSRKLPPGLRWSDLLMPVLARGNDGIPMKMLALYTERHHVRFLRWLTAGSQSPRISKARRLPILRSAQFR